MRYNFLAFERVHYTLSAVARHCRGEGGRTSLVGAASRKAAPHTSGRLLLSSEAPPGAPFVRGLCKGLLEAFKWCHERGVVLRAIDPNQMYLDRAGTVKLGCFDEASIVPCRGHQRGDKSDAAAGDSAGYTDSRSFESHLVVHGVTNPCWALVW